VEKGIRFFSKPERHSRASHLWIGSIPIIFFQNYPLATRNPSRKTLMHFYISDFRESRH
jgi:hypothetical protein